MIPRSASLALSSVLLVACGQATSATAADDPEPTPSPTLTSSASTPTPSSPKTSSATRPLNDFPLARGYPETNGDDGSPVVVTDKSGLEKLVLCHEGAWTPRAPIPPIDLIGATYDGEAEDSRGITLARYDSLAAAEDVLAHVRTIVGSCPADGEIGGVYAGNDRHTGDEAFTLTQRFRSEYGFDTGLVVYDFVRVGDLLLVDWAYGEGGGSDETIKSSQREVTDQSGALLPYLCEYAVPACAVREPTPQLTIGPDGIDGVHLGMSASAAADAGLLGEPRHDGSGCSAVSRDDGTTVLAADLRPGVGIVTLHAPSSRVMTPEGVGTGSTAQEVSATYPEAEGDEALLHTPVPGHPERAYWFWFGPEGFVTDVMLMLPDQRCYG